MSLLLSGDLSNHVWRAALHKKRLVDVITLLLFARLCSVAQASGPRDEADPAGSICITVECDIRTLSLCSFLLHLTDDDNHRWFEIPSDSSLPSFIKLPLEDRVALAPSALNFFVKSLEFFRTTGTDTLRATFECGQDSLGAIFVHSGDVTDSCSSLTSRRGTRGRVRSTIVRK